MAAYSVPIELKCCRCKIRAAKEEVFNSFNSSCGKMCKSCAKKIVAELNRETRKP